VNAAVKSDLPEPAVPIMKTINIAYLMPLFGVECLFVKGF
jgi:hypothetical protein